MEMTTTMNVPAALRQEFTDLLTRVHFEFEKNKNANTVRKVRSLMTACPLNWGEMRRLIAHVRRGAVIYGMREPHGKTVQWVSVLTSYAPQDRSLSGDRINARETVSFHFSL
jgi:hypothetical protein